MTIHQKIAEALVAQATKADSPLKTLLDGKTIQQVCHLIFQSYRGGPTQAKGMRLSDVGLQLMKAFFKCHDIKLTPGYRLASPHLIYLDRVSKMPYWLNDEYCAIFDTELAMMLRLVDGSLQNLLDSRFRLTSKDDSLNADM